MAHDNWYTPKEIIEPIRSFYSDEINYDPCSCIKANQAIKASTFNSIDDPYSPAMWDGNIWINPPYCDGDMRVWLTRANTNYRDNDLTEQVIALVNRSDAQWYYDFLDRHEGGYYQFRKRIKFIDGETGKRSSPRYNNDLIYWGKNPKGFSEMCLHNYGRSVRSSFYTV
jgi:DNA N-6-adenine-methyltransferase (Dam)